MKRSRARGTSFFPTSLGLLIPSIPVLSWEPQLHSQTTFSSGEDKPFTSLSVSLVQSESGEEEQTDADLRESLPQPEVEGGLPSPQQFSDCMHIQSFQIPVDEPCLHWSWGRVASGVADLGADMGSLCGLWHRSV